MPLISQEDIQRVIDASDLVSIAEEVLPDLKQRGGSFTACCPFHHEKTPSFHIDVNKQLWHCFGCGEGGNVVGFVEKKYDMSFVEAIQFLADKAGIQLTYVKSDKNFADKSTRGRLISICNETADFYHNQLMKVRSAACNQARSYLGKRGFGSAVSKRWTLGFAPGSDSLVHHLVNKHFDVKDMLAANVCVKGRDGRAHDRFFNRVMFPIRDTNNDVIAFGGRVMDDSQPKYLNSSENPIFHKSNVLFGLDKAKSHMTATGTAVVVEGYTDVIAMHEAGINFVVATLGTALTRQHIRILNQHAKKKIIYLFDGDAAGQRAAQRALNFIDQMQLPEKSGQRAQLMATTLPENLDPAEFLEKYGKDEMLKQLDGAQQLLDYGIEKKIAEYDLSVGGNKARAATAAVRILAPIKDSLLASEYVQKIASMTGLPYENVAAELAKTPKPKEYDGDRLSAPLATDGSDQPLQTELNQAPVNTPYEDELLSVLSRNMNLLHDLSDELSSLAWKNPDNANIFKLINDAYAQNKNISSAALIQKINEQNKAWANKLTKMSSMLDLQTDPKRHVLFLIYSLQISLTKSQIAELKMHTAAGNDNGGYDKIFELTQKLSELKTKRNKVS